MINRVDTHSDYPHIEFKNSLGGKELQDLPTISLLSKHIIIKNQI